MSKKRQKHRVAPSGIKSGHRSAPSIADDRDSLDIVIRQALDNIELAATPGTKSSAWGIDRDLLLEMCESNIINKVPVQQVLANFEQVITDAAATPRCVARFIERVRAECNRLRNKAWQVIKAEEKLSGGSDDPLERFARVVDRLTFEVMTGMQAGDLTNGTVGERHALIRSVEVVMVAAEKIAAARLKNIQADRLLALADKLDGEAKKGTTTISIKQIADEVRAAAGGTPQA